MVNEGPEGWGAAVRVGATSDSSPEAAPLTAVLKREMTA